MSPKEAASIAGGPAFPHTITVGDDVHVYLGLSALDYFAAVALAAIIQSDGVDHLRDEDHRSHAKSAFKAAQAMIALRELK